MRKLFVICFTVFLLSLVTGCSLPIGDGLLTISSEGVDFIKSENNEQELAEGDEDGAMPADTQTGANDETDDDAELDDVANDSQSAEMNDSDRESNEQEGSNTNNSNCEKQDHSRVLQQIGNDFYIPDCAVITSQTF